MSASIVLPSVIQGPAYIAWGGIFIYVKDKIDVDEMLAIFNPETTMGDAGERLKSRMFKLSFTPVGMVNAGLIDAFFEAHIAPATYIGQSIFPASNFAVTIYSVAENKTYGYVQGGISKVPDLFLGPSATAYGQMELTCIGAKATAPTATNFIKQTGGTIGSLDTSFSESQIVTDIYQGVLGSLSAPYNSIGSMDGFTIKFGFKTKTIAAADVGIADIVIDAKGFNIGVEFAPSNLTEAQVDTLLEYQGASALLPGQAFADNTNSGALVLTGINSGHVFTVNALGAKSIKRIYQIGEHRYPKGALSMVNKLPVTTGAVTALFGFTA